MQYLIVFAVGGLICVLGQILMDATRLTPPRILVLLVVLGAVLTAVGVYEPFAEWAKNGATVPLPGFGYNLAKGAMDAVKDDGFMGALTGGLKNTAAGIATAIGFGYLVALVFSPKAKR